MAIHFSFTLLLVHRKTSSNVMIKCSITCLYLYHLLDKSSCLSQLAKCPLHIATRPPIIGRPLFKSPSYVSRPVGVSKRSQRYIYNHRSPSNVNYTYVSLHIYIQATCLFIKQVVALHTAVMTSDHRSLHPPPLEVIFVLDNISSRQPSVTKITIPRHTPHRYVIYQKSSQSMTINHSVTIST